jgi:50S ribosomal subunit-associated GTPase HflX
VDRSILHTVAKEHPRSVFISAVRGINLLGLKTEVLALLEEEFVERVFTVSQGQQKLISQLHSAGEIRERSYVENSVVLRMRIPKKDVEQLERMVEKAGEAGEDV